MKINLQAKDESQKRILEYLENNASDILANKINNGVQVEKDGKQLLSKKDLDSFFNYANTEAKKLAENKSYACIDDKTVYGWAIHYFEEDEIQGKLFNLDGTEYEPPKPVKKETPKVEVKEKPKQPSLFDFMTEPEKEDKVEEQLELDPLFDDNEEDVEDIPPMKEIAGRNVDTSTGEVISNNNETFDKYILKTIAVAFDGKVKLQ
ncbi:MAG: hypothetical protein IJ538_00530 [Clostridia bacterium]|nr:hypothetical protein [Clostridia bacterium]